jgi:Emfourin
MQLKVRRTGGFAGIARESPVLDTETLPPEEAQELHALVEEAKLDEVGVPRRGPDRFTYELTVGDRRVTLPESEMTPARRALVKRLGMG